MTKPNDVWHCSECEQAQGRHDMWFDGDLCEECNERKIPCRGCQTKQDVEEQCDAYGYSTGYWCDSCYESDRYPYRRDRYFDSSYAGERLEDDY
jgi:hypothetical protein